MLDKDFQKPFLNHLTMLSPHVYYACHGLPYGKEDQTSLIDDDPSKVFQNPKWNGFFLELFRG